MSGIYLYGTVMITESFILSSPYPEADGYAEVQRHDKLLSGETGVAAALLAALGCQVKLGGTHLGYETADQIYDYFKDKTVDLSDLVNDKEFKGVIDYALIAGKTRTCLGQWGTYFSSPKTWFEAPSEEAVKEAELVGADPYFGDAIVELCRKHSKQYACIDCAHDSKLHQYSAVNVVSHQFLKSNYAGIDLETVHRQYCDNSLGLTIFTRGSLPVLYGRKNQPLRYAPPYDVPIVSTLGAGDSFKAGSLYGLYKGMSDDELVDFANAVAALACSRYPIADNPARLEEVKALQQEGKKCEPV